MINLVNSIIILYNLIDKFKLDYKYIKKASNIKKEHIL